MVKGHTLTQMEVSMKVNMKMIVIGMEHNTTKTETSQGSLRMGNGLNNNHPKTNQ